MAGSLLLWLAFVYQAVEGFRPFMDGLGSPHKREWHISLATNLRFHHDQLAEPWPYDNQETATTIPPPPEKVFSYPYYISKPIAGSPSF